MVNKETCDSWFLEKSHDPKERRKSGIAWTILVAKHGFQV